MSIGFLLTSAEGWIPVVTCWNSQGWMVPVYAVEIVPSPDWPSMGQRAGWDSTAWVDFNGHDIIGYGPKMAGDLVQQGRTHGWIISSKGKPSDRTS